MQQMAAQLGIVSEIAVPSGMQILKLASAANFIQGRRMDMVIAVCLYSACRKITPCKVMLIDFADILQVCPSFCPFSLPLPDQIIPVSPSLTFSYLSVHFFLYTPNFLGQRFQTRTYLQMFA
jgi:hypothetical protein